MIGMLLLLSYFLGSVPFGLILAYMYTGKDIRSHGSGNIGATNALRSGGKFVGILTLILDSAKGVIAVLAARYYSPDPEIMQYICGFLAFIGHIFPVWLKFNGGKGVATAFGIIAVLHPDLALACLCIWLVTLLVFRMVSLASVVTGVFTFIAVWVLLYYHEVTGPAQKGIVITVMCPLMIFRHKSNIARIAQKKEPKI